MNIKGTTESLVWALRSLLRGIRPSDRFQHDYTIDFDVTVPLPEGATRILEEVVGALREVGVDAIVAEGTLLGLVRDGRLIPHDTDLDLYVVDPSNAVKVVHYLESRGWIVGQHARIGSVSTHVTLFNADRVLLDLTFFEQVGQRLMSFKERDGYLVIDDGVLLPPKAMSQYEHLLIPNDPEVFLERYYGSDWRVPKESKMFWKDEYCGIFVREIDDIVLERRAILRDAKRWAARPNA